MLDRGRAARLSIFISVSGFTRVFIDHAQSLARNNLLMVAVSGSDVERLMAEQNFDVSRWLEEMIAKQASGRVERNAGKRASKKERPVTSTRPRTKTQRS